MTTFRTSSPIGQSFTPRGPQRAAIRQQMYGKIIPANDSHTIGPIGVLIMVVCAGLIALMLAIGGVR